MLPLKLLLEDPLVLPFMLQMCFSILQQEANRLLLQVKQEKMDRDDCNLDLKVEVNISSECSLSSGECLHLLDVVVQTSGWVRPHMRVPRAEPDQETGCYGNSSGYFGVFCCIC